MVVRADANLYFPGVEGFREALNQATETESFGNATSLMIDLTHVSEIDYTALKVIYEFFCFMLPIIPGCLFEDASFSPG